jgi:SNF2 family DNA or RNA helicase
MAKVRADLDKTGRRILLHAGYDPRIISQIKKIPGQSFRKVDKVWAVPADIPTGQLLRKLLGDELVLEPRLLAWAKAERKKQRNLRAISTSDDVPLGQLRLATVLPALAESLWPHQRADVAFMSKTSCINANEQGTGKTRSVIGAVYEAGLESKPHLVIADVQSIEATWAAELEQWLPEHVMVLASEDAKERKVLIGLIKMYVREKTPFWLVINKEMVRYRATYGRVKGGSGRWRKVETGLEAVFPELFDIDWGTVTIDEFQKAGLSNPKTLGARAFSALSSELRWAMSGTPMQGKPLNLFGALRWLDKRTFSSKTTWTNQWLHVEKDQYTGFEHIGGIAEGKEDAFYEHLAPYMVRRLKEDVFPDLPPKEYQDVWCKMTPAQSRQYEEFAADAEIRIDELHLTAQGVLAEYARLRILATTHCRAEGKITYDWVQDEERQRIKLISTGESGKFPKLLSKLQECGVEPSEDQLGALVGTQDRSIAEQCAAWLTGFGYRVALLIGGVKTRDIVRDFQAAGPDNPQIIVMTVQKGGTALTLDRADSVHILDESWIPDEQEQFEDRAHRGSRMHRVRVFYYLSRGTIDEYVREVTDQKMDINNVLDLRRKGLRAI